MRVVPAITAVFMCLLSSQSQAVLVEITGAIDDDINGEWEISTVTGSFFDLQNTLENQVWWSDAPDDTLAVLFATALGDALTIDTSSDFDIGPEFAFFFGSSQIGTTFKFFESSSVATNFPIAIEGIIDYQGTFAIAEQVSVPTPGSISLIALSLLGLRAFRRRVTKQGIAGVNSGSVAFRSKGWSKL